MKKTIVQAQKEEAKFDFRDRLKNSAHSFLTSEQERFLEIHNDKLGIVGAKHNPIEQAQINTQWEWIEKHNIIRKCECVLITNNPNIKELFAKTNV